MRSSVSSRGMAVNTCCAWTVPTTRRRPRLEVLGTGLRTQCWPSTGGRAAKEGACPRCSARTGRMAPRCICRAIAKASLDMRIGVTRCRPKSGDQPTGSCSIWSSSMNFSIAGTMRRLLAPRHELSISWFLWRRLCRRLRERGKHRSRESGAFLLGCRRGGRARIVDFVLYDDLDPHCLDSGIVRFDGRHFGKVWALCKDRGLTVVADVHVHPGGAGQSESDRAHPMISRAGHIALILPHFAAMPLPRREIGIYRYRGDKRWTAVPAATRRSFFHIGL